MAVAGGVGVGERSEGKGNDKKIGKQEAGREGDRPEKKTDSQRKDLGVDMKGHHNSPQGMSQALGGGGH